MICVDNCYTGNIANIAHLLAEPRFEVDGRLARMDTPAGVTAPVNIGNPAECTVRELTERVIGLTGSEATFEFRLLPPGDPVRCCPDTTRAQDELGWTPRTALDAGLERTIAYLRDLTGVAGQQRPGRGTDPRDALP